MTTFNWSIVSMPACKQVDGEDVVFQVNWQCSATDGKNEIANSFGSVSVAYVTGAPFTAYAELTQEQVWSWINPNIDREEIEANLQAMIDSQKTPSVVTPPLPWSTQTQE